ncbi:GNAT family N-acetyltransferase [Stappia sp. F7233]|uniref:GNAT family N-acetyltransferase n=1 Tax=Stappia albiluteola TaxID=2758565 RepID=A0A839ABJ2_9HYPH|nr:GNAT family N-acetyltransferase [Stappia albiluteola]MBA5777050.1 GNAT family N-acetyltransferase [Stappia albiluteola]
MVADLEEFSDESSHDAALLPQETARLKLDLPRKDDLADIVFLANNRRVAAMLATMPHPFTLEDARRMVARAENNGTERATFAVRLKSTGRFIGSVGFGSFEAGGPVQIGYWIGEPFQGQGYATEAVQTLVDHVFEATPIARLDANVRVINPPSRRVLVKSGFQYRDQSMLVSKGAGGSVPVERFCLDRGTWDALKRWGARNRLARSRFPALAIRE